MSELKLRHTKDGVILPVRLTPKSARNEISDIEDFGWETVIKARARSARGRPGPNGVGAPGRDVARSTAVIGEGGARQQSRTMQVLIEVGADRLATLIDAKLAKLAER